MDLDENFPILQVTTDAGRSIAEAASIAGGNVAPGPDHESIESSRLSRVSQEQQRLLTWAKALGKVKRTLPPEHTRGSEHLVHIDQDTMRVIRSTRHDRHKGYGISLGSHTHGATPAEYLDRLHLQNQLFADDIKFEYLVNKQGCPIIVTSQPFIDGPNPSQEELNGIMQVKGFEQFIDGAYYKASLGLLVYDLIPRNAKKNLDGSVYPFDPVLQRIDSEFAAFLRENPDRIHNR